MDVSDFSLVQTAIAKNNRKFEKMEEFNCAILLSNVQNRQLCKCVFFNRLAEVTGEYLHKGAKIYVEGSLRTRKWQDKSGNERYTTEIIANEMYMLDSKINEKNTISNKNNITSSFENSVSSVNEDDDIPF